MCRCDLACVSSHACVCVCVSLRVHRCVCVCVSSVCGRWRGLSVFWRLSSHACLTGPWKCHLPRPQRSNTNTHAHTHTRIYACTHTQQSHILSLSHQWGTETAQGLLSSHHTVQVRPCACMCVFSYVCVREREWRREGIILQLNSKSAVTVDLKLQVAPNKCREMYPFWNPLITSQWC